MCSMGIWSTEVEVGSSDLWHHHHHYHHCYYSGLTRPGCRGRPWTGWGWSPRWQCWATATLELCSGTLTEQYSWFIETPCTWFHASPRCLGKSVDGTRGENIVNGINNRGSALNMIFIISTGLSNYLSISTYYLQFILTSAGLWEARGLMIDTNIVLSPELRVNK